jgi:hypothetical protein
VLNLQVLSGYEKYSRRISCTITVSPDRKETIMKNRVQKRLMGLIILAAVSMMPLSTAFAQDSRVQMASYVSEDASENFEMIMARMDAVNPGVEKNDADLLKDLLQPDTSTQEDLTVKEDSCGNTECLLTAPR